MPSHSAPREDVTDPIEHEHELDIETSSLAARELARLLDQDDMDFGSTTVRIDARELDALLDQARPEHERRLQNRPVPAPPPSRPMQTTLPYDAVTAYALLDKDDVPLEPTTGAPDADDLVDAEDDDEDDLEPISGPVDAEPIAPVIEAPRAFAPSVAPIVAMPAPPLSTPPAVSAWASASTTTPLPAPIGAPPARASLPSVTAQWPDEDARKRRSRMVVAIVGVLAAMGLVYLVVTEPDAAPTAPAPTVAVAVPLPPAAAAPASRSLAEIDARKALTRLRDGMGDCVRRAIGSLPGSSPAVPATMKQTSGIGYTAAPTDWKTAVWSCAKFRHDAPMQFQVQWQSLKPGLEADGLAWIDDNGDGEPDRVLGFHATAKGAHDVDLGEIEPMEMRPVVAVH